ncbi:MAG: MlaD family protein [Granulosicoccus sp.]
MLRRSPAMPVLERARDLSARFSLAWLLPLAAILFACWVLWDSYVQRGPLVRIRFDNAGGVVAGETRIRRNDVDVGTVEAVRLADDLNSVIVEARLDPQVAPYLDDNTRFWIVNARINTTEISGLGTLLSGSYIGVDWDDTQGDKQSDFIGLDQAPLTARNSPGLRLTLNADEAGYIYVGSPVFLRQVEVGRVERRRLSDDASQVLFDIFIESPYHNSVYPETRFYGVSGMEASLDSDGATFRVESVAAFFTGGIAFENSPMPGSVPVAEDGSRFKLYDNRSAARDSLFDDTDDVRFRYVAEFSGSVKGLKTDAPVEYNGLVVGRVVSVSAGLPSEPGKKGSALVVLQFQPTRLGLHDVTGEELLDTLSQYVKKGLRVQLATGNLLTGTLIVKLVDRPEAPEAHVDIKSNSYPRLPVTQSNVEAVTKDVETLVRKLSELPLDSLVTAATELLRDTQQLVSSPDIEKLPGQLSASLTSIANAAARVESATADLPTMMSALTSASENANDVLQGLSPDSEIYVELSAAVRELRLAARSIAAFAELLEENPNAIITGR